jgi:hypothetical protein
MKLKHVRDMTEAEKAEKLAELRKGPKPEPLPLDKRASEPRTATWPRSSESKAPYWSRRSLGSSATVSTAVHCGRRCGSTSGPVSDPPTNLRSGLSSLPAPELRKILNVNRRLAQLAVRPQQNAKVARSHISTELNLPGAIIVTVTRCDLFSGLSVA